MTSKVSAFPMVEEKRAKALVDVADLIETQGHVNVSDALREGKDMSLVRMRPFTPPPDEGTLEEIVARNPGSSLEDLTQLFELRARMIIVEVGNEWALIEPEVAEKIKAAAQGIL